MIVFPMIVLLPLKKTYTHDDAQTLSCVPRHLDLPHLKTRHLCTPTRARASAWAALHASHHSLQHDRQGVPRLPTRATEPHRRWGRCLLRHLHAVSSSQLSRAVFLSQSHAASCSLLAWQPASSVIRHFHTFDAASYHLLAWLREEGQQHHGNHLHFWRVGASRQIQVMPHRSFPSHSLPQRMHPRDRRLRREEAYWL